MSNYNSVLKLIFNRKEECIDVGVDERKTDPGCS